MKKMLIITMATCLAIVFYFSTKSSDSSDFNVVDTVEDEKLIIQKDEVEKIPTQESEKVVIETTDTIEKLNKPSEVKIQMEDWDKEIDRIEAQYNEKMSSLFLEELGLDERTFKDYLGMRKGLDNDKLRAFESFHKEMEQKYGENYSYNPTDEEIQFEKDIQLKYENNLLILIGKENYIRYKEVRDRFNEALMEKQDPDKGVVLMDF